MSCTSARSDHEEDLGREASANDREGEEALKTNDVEEALRTGDARKLRKIAKSIYGFAWQRSEEAKAAFRLGDIELARTSAVLSHEAWVMIRPVLDHMRLNQGHMDDHVRTAVERHAMGAKNAAVDANLEAFARRWHAESRLNTLNLQEGYSHWMSPEDELFWSSLWQARRERLARGKRSPDLRVPHGKPYIEPGG